MQHFQVLDLGQGGQPIEYHQGRVPREQAAGGLRGRQLGATTRLDVAQAILEHGLRQPRILGDQVRLEGALLVHDLNLDLAFAFLPFLGLTI